MTMSEAQVFAESNLSDFKARMRIATNDEGEMNNLKSMLSASFVVVTSLVGVNTADDEDVKELVFERSRYVYNDAADEFLNNYKQDIHYAYVAHLDETEDKA
jgi:hypothetical protein